MKSVAPFCLALTAWLTTLPAAFGLAPETQRQCLSGHGKDDAVPWKFFCTAGSQSGYWTNLPVPSNWEAHGFGTPNYSHDSTNAFDEQGRYQHAFTVPAQWATGRVFLVFDGVMTDTHAELNGHAVGPDHQGSFYRFKYDVTSLLQFHATNLLEVLVHKHSANASVNRAERQSDYWLFGGIFRPVYLEAVPAQFIERVAIDARADGAVAVDVFANPRTNSDPSLVIAAQITDLDGQPIGQPFAQALAGPQTTLQTQIRSPRQWTAETPNLYQVTVQLRQGSEVLHQLVQRFGFRTMEVREGDGLYVNGRRVILQGADRHSFWPDSGRCLSETVHRQDIELMKDMNFNAVRMSHYPPDEQFLDLCDELGLYVLDELGGWQACYDTPTGRKLIEEMVTRDVNHPCILFWDNGNEGGWNTEVDPEFGRWDPQQRRVLHPWTTFSGVNTAHYLTYSRAKAACEGTSIFRRKDYSDLQVKTNPVPAIYMPTEFLHGLYDGGAGAGMEDYWTLMRQSKTLG
ncbi:MAG TPA: glycoside hydrolase family 2 TIM barrel-domain containing protein, partial [Candidatus Sulfotelmatobacter sp.]|nr:glycoside hydrolase family 2 TIM barrel-domain containing protein [Candidatus Sulfotelmatobacter sp.]